MHADCDLAWRYRVARGALDRQARSHMQSMATRIVYARPPQKRAIPRRAPADDPPVIPSPIVERTRSPKPVKAVVISPESETRVKAWFRKHIKLP